MVGASKSDLVNIGSSTVISTATTTVVASGPGVVVRIIVTGGTLGAIDLYNNIAASGTKIAAFDATTGRGTYEIGAVFTTGLTVVTGAATNVTVITA